jgi:hypothetical protein
VATVADVQASALPLDLLDRAIPGATNDEMLELAYRVIENLAERSERAVDLAIESDDRDVENEALAFACEVDRIPNSFSQGRIRAVHDTTFWAKQDIQVAIQNRRARLEGRHDAIQRYSYRRSQRATQRARVDLVRVSTQGRKTRKRANVTRERVLAALATAVDVSSSDNVRVADVIVALDKRLADGTVPGRQQVVADVSKVLRELASEGRVQRIRPDNYDGGRRKPHRYALPEADDAS